MTYIFFQCTDIAATAVEQIVYFMLIDMIYKRKSEKLFYRIAPVAVMVLAITLLNRISLFSYVSTYVIIVLISFISVLFYRIRLLSAIFISMLFCLTLYIVDLFIITFIEVAFNSGIVYQMGAHGWTRLFVTVAAKSVLIGLYLAFRWVFRFFDGKRIFGRYKILMIVMCMFAYAYIIYLTNVIHYGSLYQLKLSGVIEWLIVLAFFIALALSFISLTDRQERQNEAKTLKAINAIYYKDYETLSKVYMINSKNYHDFNNHLIAIRDLITNEKYADAQAYIDDIYHPLYTLTQSAWTGVAAVDAIISDKYNKAVDFKIRMEVDAEYINKTKIQLSDMCAIVSNLLDNAIEASINEPQRTEKQIRFSVRVIHSMILMKAENRAHSDPLLTNPRLQTGKSDRSHHGWGLKSVLYAVKKYDGNVEFRYQDGWFSVIVMLPAEDSPHPQADESDMEPRHTGK